MASLQQMLDARERRALRQQNMLAHCRTVVSLTLVAPGEEKSGPLYDRLFDEALPLVRSSLSSFGPVLREEQTRSITGSEALFGLGADATEVKKLCVTLEEDHPCGRCFDIDVLDREGKKSRTTPRRCLLCEKAAHDCSRSRAHPIEDVKEAIARLALRPLAQEWADKLASLACESLIFELLAHPKPGLVTPLDSGSHSDMDAFSFGASIAALTPHFRRIALWGWQTAFCPRPQFEALRPLGLEAEKAMLDATSGVNTHKGAIFCLGLALAAAAALACRGLTPTAQALGKEVQSLLGDQLSSPNADSHGATVFRSHGLTGARGEALSGFQRAQDQLPLYCSDQGAHNQRLVLTLLSLCSTLEDTNMVYRGGIEKAKEAKELSKQTFQSLLKGSSTAAAELEALCDFYKKGRLSPGGAADLLALTHFLSRINSIQSEETK